MLSREQVVARLSEVRDHKELGTDDLALTAANAPYRWQEPLFLLASKSHYILLITILCYYLLEMLGVLA